LRLDGHERSILVFSANLPRAERAVKELKENGFMTVQVDKVKAGSGEASDRLYSPVTGQVPGLAHVVLGTDPAGRDEAVMQAAHPDVSGMADGSRQEPQRRVLVTVVAGEKEMPRAEAILKKHGGMW